jgi:glyoxylase-like metal-dependent hydrolase (beta-lactamase superfamily II)
VIIEKVVVGPFATNCYIVGDESTKEGIIIDPGDEAKKILERVDELGLDIKLILLTHGHIDHVGALKEVKEATNAEVAIHIDDANFKRYRSSGLVLGLFYPHPPAPDRLLKDGDTLDIAGMRFEVIHTPGHTAGGICLLRDGVVFSGDTLFNYGIGRSDLLGGNHSQLLESIRSKLLVLDDDTVVYPGHGDDTTIATERKGNPFLSS